MEYKTLTEFYPTPPELIAKMVSGINLANVNYILEPSAGKGDIADFVCLARQYLNSSRRYWKYDPDVIKDRIEIRNEILTNDVVKDFKEGKRASTERNYKVYCVELDKTLCSILKDKKEYVVLNEDFLQYNDYQHFDLIIMNPPFSNGDEHLLKAIEIAKGTGSQIVCLLNAETIRNPYSNKRKELIRQLEKYDATYEYVQNAFTHAERATDVEIVIVKVTISEPVKQKSRIWEELEENEIEVHAPEWSNDIVSADDPMRMAVGMYQKEIKAGKTLIEEYLALKPYLSSTFDTDHTPLHVQGCLLSLFNNVDKKTLDWNDYVYSVRYKYWYELLHNPSFMGNLTSNIRNEYFEMIREFANKDFSLKNIYSVKMDILSRTAKGIEDKIVSLFEKFSYEHSMEAAGNVHYFNGWKSNSAFKINQKIVIPYLPCWDTTYNKFRYDSYGHNLKDLLDDVEKCLRFLEIGESEYIYDRDLDHWIKYYESQQQTKKMVFRHIDIDVFKKGTVHIRFRDPELLKRFNIYGCQHKGWLPPSYGKKSYKDMTKEEQQVIDEYEGQKEYEKVYANRENYILSPERTMLLLNA